jgi:hypothetical protein
LYADSPRLFRLWVARIILEGRLSRILAAWIIWDFLYTDGIRLVLADLLLNISVIGIVLRDLLFNICDIWIVLADFAFHIGGTIILGDFVLNISNIWIVVGEF